MACAALQQTVVTPAADSAEQFATNRLCMPDCLSLSVTLPSCCNCDRTLFNVTTAECLCRCPNPAACGHDPRALALVHPDSKTAGRVSWLQYGQMLCDYREGYTGPLCGVCLEGFGQVTPFQCRRCLGTDVVFDARGSEVVVQTGPRRISGLYFAYWLVLTCWLVLCVRFSMPSAYRSSKRGSTAGSTAAAAVGAGAAAAPAGPAGPTVPAGQVLQQQLRLLRMQQQQQHSEAPAGPPAGDDADDDASDDESSSTTPITAAAAGPPTSKEDSRSLDIAKVSWPPG